MWDFYPPWSDKGGVDLLEMVAKVSRLFRKKEKAATRSSVLLPFSDKSTIYCTKNTFSRTTENIPKPSTKLLNTETGSTSGLSSESYFAW